MAPYDPDALPDRANRVSQMSAWLAGGMALVCCAGCFNFTNVFQLSRELSGFLVIACFIFGSALATAGIVTGVIGLVQIRKTGEFGKHQAELAVGLSAIGLVALVWITYLNLDDTPVRDRNGVVTESGYVKVTQTRVGDCTDLKSVLDLASSVRIRVVPCAEPHRAELFAAFHAESHDGWTAVGEPAEQQCVARFATGFPAADIHAYEFAANVDIGPPGKVIVRCFAFTEDLRLTTVRGM